MTELSSTSIAPKINVDLGDRSYPIFIGSGQLAAVGISRFVQGKKALIVTNTTVAKLYLSKLEEQLVGKQVDSIVLEDGEKFKNLETLNGIFSQLLENNHDRKTTLIALGGGVVGDITGFAAACYQRGVPFIQIPTTLLSQVDSSVGGKTAVNHPMGKNMIGAFYQPQAVIIDTDSLATLPKREFSAGMAEVIKYGLISDAEFFSWLEDNSDALMQGNQDAFAYAIERSCLNKAKVVSADETEQGMRAILNLGHTFGHAIETFQNYSGWLHGEAVAAGMVMACELSMMRGALTEAEFNRVKQLIQRWDLPIAPPAGMGVNDFECLMYRDKKVLDGQLRLVLLRSLGDAEVTSEFTVSSLNTVLSSSCTTS